MDEEVNAYLNYLSSLGEIKKPKMPKFDATAYTDFEYINAISGITSDYEKIDDFDVTIKFLKGK
ncbi:MAG: hypothetical protein MJ152_01090 [Clostridia bacterium]|nr:hypothetical protein [Clostridia bacterium]